MEQTEFTPKPSGKATKFYLHLANWSEFFTWFSGGIAISFLCQLIPKMFLLYPLGFVFTLLYFVVSFQASKQGNILRILAVTSSLIGFWNLFYLYRDYFANALIITIVLLALGGAFIWSSFLKEK